MIDLHFTPTPNGQKISIALEEMQLPCRLINYALPARRSAPAQCRAAVADLAGASLGPMGGQAAHFLRYAPERIEYAIERYSQEALRLPRILERRLGEAEHLAGDEYSIADIAVWPSQRFTADAEKFPNTSRWAAVIAERPAAVRGLAAERAIPAKYMQRRAVLSPAEWSNLFGERMRGAVDL